MALRSSDRTTTIRVKLVAISRIAGATDRTVRSDEQLKRQRELAAARLRRPVADLDVHTGDGLAAGAAGEQQGRAQEEREAKDPRSRHRSSPRRTRPCGRRVE